MDIILNAPESREGSFFPGMLSFEIRRSSNLRINKGKIGSYRGSLSVDAGYSILPAYR